MHQQKVRKWSTMYGKSPRSAQGLSPMADCTSACNQIWWCGFHGIAHLQKPSKTQQFTPGKMQCQEAQQRFRLRITLCCRLATLIFCQVVTSTTQVSDSGLQLESTIAVTRCFCFSKCKSKGWKQPCCSMKALNHSPVDMFIQGIISIRIICKLCMKVCWAATGLGFCFSICWLRLFNFLRVHYVS